MLVLEDMVKDMILIMEWTIMVVLMIHIVRIDYSHDFLVVTHNNVYSTFF